jgi:hypothetical protein
LPGQPATATKKKASEVLQEQLDLLRARYSDNHPDVIRMRAELAKVKRAEEEQKIADPADVATATPGKPASSRSTPPVAEPAEFARTREQAAELRAQIKAVDKELEGREAEQQHILAELDMYQRRVERLPVREQEMAQITRDYEMAKTNYKSLLDKKTAAGMALDMERMQQAERFTVLDRAQVPNKPIKPNRPLLYSGAAILGLMFGLAVGFAAELRQNVVLGEWELPRGTPVLARLPHIEVKAASDQTKSASGGGWFHRGKGLTTPSITAWILAGGTAGAWLNSLLHRLQ